MVKRTAVVLGIVSLAIMMTGSAMAFVGGLPTPPCFGAPMCDARPFYVPVDCPDPIQKTIVKKWECKIVGPCPPVAPAAAVGGCGKDDRMGLMLSLATAIMTPMDLLVAPFDGVYGCLGGAGGGACCGSCLGPLPGALMAVGGIGGCGGTTFFGGLW
jgi:hypothetical protein